jgi:class 3 adenylate cyclase
MVELGGEAHVVLPYEKASFFEDSVDIIPGANWRERSQRVLDQAVEIVTVSGQRLAAGSVSYDYANQVLHGLAIMRAGHLETDVIPLAVWNGEAGDGPGGTASTVDRWRALGYKVELIDPKESLRNEDSELTVSTDRPSLAPTPEGPRTERPEIVGIMFADVKGFSKLKEEETGLFVQHFLGMVADLVAKSPHPPALKDTRGDGLYFVFPSVADAGEFALDLSERVKNTNWASKRLPKELSLRIGLHAGPVYRCTDPVTQLPNYIGTHIVTAARIEPITPPNCVYASQAFAALASAIQTKTFQFDYVGQTPLAKGFGTFPMYSVRRTNA